MTSDGVPQRTGNNLDPWYANYAERAAGLAASEVRALFAVASRPEVVSLAGGMPFVSALPQDLIVSSMQRVMAEQGPTALQYGSGQGIPALREQILEVMALEGIAGTVDNVVTATGSQQALDLVAKLFIDPGDVILAESPSYVGALGVFRSYQANVVHVAMDENGLIPEALRQTIAHLRGQGRRIKFLYTIPNFHNPAGVTLSASRRPEILEICRSNEILVLEDNPYGLAALRRAGARRVARARPRGRRSTSGRSRRRSRPDSGWAGRSRRTPSARSSSSPPSRRSCRPRSFSQLVVSEYLANADWKGQIDTFRGVYRERKDAMIDALGEHLPQLSWTNPNGGFYVWVTMPDVLDSKQMLPRAVKELVAYTPGTAFFADGRGRHAMRLSFCYPTPEAIRLGVRRLATVVNGELDLLDTFAGTGTLQLPPSSGYESAPPSDLK